MSNIVVTCRRTWRRLGVPRAQANEMAAELAVDLASASEDGVDAESSVGHDARGFAQRWAEARGLVRPRRRLLTTGLAAVLGAIPGAVFALFAAYGLSSQTFADIFGEETLIGGDLYMQVFEPPGWLILALYALGAAFAYAGAVFAAGATLRLLLDPAADVTVRMLAAALPVATVAAIAASMIFAWSQGYSTQPDVVIGDALVAMLVFGTSAAAIRLRALRRFTSERAPMGALSSSL